MTSDRDVALQMKRKAYQTTSRPLADIIFAIALSIFALLEAHVFLQFLPSTIGLAAVGITTSLIYIVLINLLTVFRVKLPHAVVSSLLTGLLVALLSKTDLYGEHEILLLNTAPILIAICHMTSFFWLDRTPH